MLPVCLALGRLGRRCLRAETKSKEAAEGSRGWERSESKDGGMFQVQGAVAPWTLTDTGGWVGPGPCRP